LVIVLKKPEKALNYKTLVFEEMKLLIFSL